MTNRKRKEGDAFAVALMNRFMRIRTILNEKSYTKMAPIKAEVKGGARMYTQLRAQNLVIPDKKGRLIWNESIPITYTLALTIAKELRRLSIVAKVTPTKVDNSTFNEEPTFWKEKPKPKPKTKPKVEEVDEEVEEDKPSLTVSFAWGFFKYIRG